jgi:hypothetical protein
MNLATGLSLALGGCRGSGGGDVVCRSRAARRHRTRCLPDGDAERGERIFWASGCASCHAREGATGDDMLELAGGLALETDFGTFVAPNISMHPTDGIGDWSSDFANAMLRGVSPDGRHYYPAFPYTSYARMEIGDVADLYAFMRTCRRSRAGRPAAISVFPSTSVAGSACGRRSTWTTTR